MPRRPIVIALAAALAAAAFLPPFADPGRGAPAEAATDVREVRLRALELSVPSFSYTLPDPRWPEDSIGRGRFGLGVIVLVTVDADGRPLDAAEGPVLWYNRVTGDWVARPGPYSMSDVARPMLAAVAGALQSRFAPVDPRDAGGAGPFRGRVEFRWEVFEHRQLGGGAARIIGGAEHDVGLLPEPEAIAAQATVPVLVSRGPVEYPPDARTAGAEAMVILQAVIDETGAVTSAELVSAKGGAREFTSMVNNALDAVRRWRYRPAVQDGRPVAAYFTVTIEYRLE